MDYSASLFRFSSLVSAPWHTAARFSVQFVVTTLAVFEWGMRLKSLLRSLATLNLSVLPSVRFGQQTAEWGLENSQSPVPNILMLRQRGWHRLERAKDQRTAGGRRQRQRLPFDSVLGGRLQARDIRLLNYQQLE